MQQCTWLIRFPGVIRIQFIIFDTEKDFDFLRIFHKPVTGTYYALPLLSRASAILGQEDRGNMVGEYSGSYGTSRPLPLLVLEEGIATISFQADESVQREGFVIEISAVISDVEPSEGPPLPGSTRHMGSSASLTTLLAMAPHHASIDRHTHYWN